MTEKQIQNAIIGRVGRHESVRIWRQNVGVGVPIEALRGVVPWATLATLPRIKYGVPGMADLSGILSDGRRLEIEVKGRKGRLSDKQRRWATMIRHHFGVYIVARSADDVLERLCEEGYPF